MVVDRKHEDAAGVGHRAGQSTLLAEPFDGLGRGHMVAPDELDRHPLRLGLILGLEDGSHAARAQLRIRRYPAIRSGNSSAWAIALLVAGDWYSTVSERRRTGTGPVRSDRCQPRRRRSRANRGPPAFRTPPAGARRKSPEEGTLARVSQDWPAPRAIDLHVRRPEEDRVSTSTGGNGKKSDAGNFGGPGLSAVTQGQPPSDGRHGQNPRSRPPHSLSQPCPGR